MNLVTHILQKNHERKMNEPYLTVNKIPKNYDALYRLLEHSVQNDQPVTLPIGGRGIGKTHALMRLAKKYNALYICVNKGYAQDIARKNDCEDVEIVTLREFHIDQILRGRKNRKFISDEAIDIETYKSADSFIQMALSGILSQKSSYEDMFTSYTEFIRNNEGRQYMREMYGTWSEPPVVDGTRSEPPAADGTHAPTRLYNPDFDSTTSTNTQRAQDFSAHRAEHDSLETIDRSSIEREELFSETLDHGRRISMSCVEGSDHVLTGTMPMGTVLYHGREVYYRNDDGELIRIGSSDDQLSN